MRRNIKKQTLEAKDNAFTDYNAKRAALTHSKAVQQLQKSKPTQTPDYWHQVLSQLQPQAPDFEGTCYKR